MVSSDLVLIVVLLLCSTAAAETGEVYNYLLSQKAISALASPDGSCSSPCTCFGDYDINDVSIEPPSQQPLPQTSNQLNSSFFLEIDSDILCGGTLDYIQFHIYYQSVGERDGRDMEEEGASCLWTMEFGLFRRSKEQFVLVDNSSTGTFSVVGQGSNGVYDVRFNYTGSRPSVEPRDVLSVLIQIVRGECVVQPFPVSTMRTDSSISSILLNRLGNQVTQISTRELRMGVYFNTSFDAKVQLTGNALSYIL